MFSPSSATEGNLSEALMKALRFAQIDLQKLQVEVESVPLLRAIFNEVSLEELRGLLVWMETASALSAGVKGNFIPEIVQPKSWQRLKDFAAAVSAARVLSDDLSKHTAGAEIGLPALSLCQRIEIGERLHNVTADQVEVRFREIAGAWAEATEVLEFFNHLSTRLGTPSPETYTDAHKLLLVLQRLTAVSPDILLWRTPYVLDPAQRIRIQSWQDRAKPLLETRRKLDQRFKLSEQLSLQELRDLIDQLAADGIFHQFKAEFRAASEKYNSLLREGLSERVESKASGFEKAEKLKEWISFIEQSKAFLLQPEARQAFGNQFRGIDTDFKSVLEANRLGKLVIDDISGASDEFSQQLLKYVMTVPVETLAEALNLQGSREYQRVQALISAQTEHADESLSTMIRALKENCAQLRQVRELVSMGLLKESVRLGDLRGIGELAAEVQFLIRQIESDAASRALFGKAYAREATDLGVLEKTARYVKEVKRSMLPESVRAVLLSAQGPQRLTDALTFVPGVMKRLNAVSLQLIKVSDLTGSAAFEKQRISKLLESIDAIVKSGGRWNASCTQQSAWTAPSIDSQAPNVSS